MQQLQVDAPLQLNCFQLSMGIVPQGRVDLSLRRYAGGHNCITEDDSISSPCNRKSCGTPETVTKEMAPQ
ncbi:hypothetical protein BDL97_13G059100 [Sphagnum fallax]|nr:hypothetical protein BDL97_13G059100 [Sphagnum fallax]